MNVWFILRLLRIRGPKSFPLCLSQGSRDASTTSQILSPSVRLHQFSNVDLVTTVCFGQGSKPMTLSLPKCFFKTRVHNPHPAPTSMIRPDEELPHLRMRSTVSAHGNDHPRLADVQFSILRFRNKSLRDNPKPPRLRFARFPARHSAISTSRRLGILRPRSYFFVNRNKVAMARLFNMTSSD